MMMITEPGYQLIIRDTVDYHKYDNEKDDNYDDNDDDDDGSDDDDST